MFYADGRRFGTLNEATDAVWQILAADSSRWVTDEMDRRRVAVGEPKQMSRDEATDNRV